MPQLLSCCDCCTGRVSKSLLSGLAGAAALTLVHEGARQVIPHSPRVDVLGERALAGALRLAGRIPPARRRLYGWTLIGDLVSNGLVFSLVGAGPRRSVYRRGVLLGLLNGGGSLGLGSLLKLGRQPDQKTPLTQVMTVAWFALGGAVAAAVFDAIDRD